MSTSRPSLFKRLAPGVPLLATAAVQVVLIGIAAYFVSEKIINPPTSFEGTTLAESPKNQQLEHTLKVARSGGGAKTVSPVNAARILSIAKDALQIRGLPELPTSGASAMAGSGFDKGTGVGGTGIGSDTALSNANTLGVGFMPLTFLGVTNPRTNKVVFVVDIGPSLMDIRKGGFRAFEILRSEISQLVSTLPPANQFNVVLFDDRGVSLFSDELRPATQANKTAFFEWIRPINANLDSIGSRSIAADSTRWSYKPADSLKLDPDYSPSPWVNAVHAALEQKPDTLFVITGSSAAGQMRLSEESITRQKRQREKQLSGLKRDGYDLEAINAARGKALAKLRAEFNEINRKLVAQKKDPFVITEIQRVLASDFQAALRRAGFSPLKLDTAGWTDKQGRPIWFTTHVATTHNAEFSEVIGHVSKLQYGLLRGNASLNIFLFTGPEENPEGAKKNLSSLASRNSGKFRLLTTQRLEELARRKDREQ